MQDNECLEASVEHLHDEKYNQLLTAMMSILKKHHELSKIALDKLTNEEYAMKSFANYQYSMGAISEITALLEAINSDDIDGFIKQNEQKAISSRLAHTYRKKILE